MLISESTFRQIVSGQRRGLSATLLRGLLRIAEVPYTWAVARRNRQFESGSREIHRVDVPVVSVGNLTMGGTGKTPIVAWLARWFREQEIRVTIVSRGYGAEAGAKNDEALELEEQLPDVPHLQNPNRVEAASTAIEELGSELILLDDGFQHRRLARDLDIVLVDATQPLGFGHVFPRGMLREPLAGFARADVIMLTRCDQVDAERRAEIRQSIARNAPDAVWVEVAFAPRCLRNASGEKAPVDSLAKRRVVAFAGIGNPAGFRQTLVDSGYDIAAFHEFADHHAYERTDIDGLVTAAADGDAVVCTHKDLVKIGLDRLGSTPLWALEIGAQITQGEQELTAKLAKVVKSI